MFYTKMDKIEFLFIILRNAQKNTAKISAYRIESKSTWPSIAYSKIQRQTFPFCHSSNKYKISITQLIIVRGIPMKLSMRKLWSMTQISFILQEHNAWHYRGFFWCVMRSCSAIWIPFSWFSAFCHS